MSFDSTGERALIAAGACELRTVTVHDKLA